MQRATAPVPWNAVAGAWQNVVGHADRCVEGIFVPDPGGQFIQFIDVAARCSDFLAFDARAGRRLEFGLDATTTPHHRRGHYPQPAVRQVLRQPGPATGRGGARHRRPARHLRAGLHRKYYADSAIQGPRDLHDNFNAARRIRGGRTQRMAALNLFYNTAFDAPTATSDEPWSRPGDYVLLRAARLVCASRLPRRNRSATAG